MTKICAVCEREIPEGRECPVHGTEIKKTERSVVKAGVVVGATILAMLLGFGAMSFSQKPTGINREDSLELQLVSSHLDSINRQAQQAAQPELQKADTITKRVCAANHFDYPCDIDPVAMTVKAKAKEQTNSFTGGAVKEQPKDQLKGK
jgi:hypothetical protein